MPKQDPIPRPDPQFLIWHDQFKTFVTANIATFGLVAGDATQINTDNADIHTKVTAVTTTGNIASQAVADKNTSRANGEKHARALAQRIKAHPAYTTALGELGGIEGPQDTTNLATATPTLKGVAKPGGVAELTFSKSISDGVDIYSKRGTETVMTFLARDTSSPYVDNRPLLAAGQPELREYKCIYIQNDAQIGLFSNEAVVNCAP